MRETIDYLNLEVEDSPVVDLSIESTHYYVKIIPNNDQDLEFLDELDKSDDPEAPVLHEYPLDQDIVQEGDFYREVYPEDIRFNFPIYTVIPVGYQFSQPLDYDVLAEIYEPTEDQYFLEIVSLFRAGWYDDLSAEFDEEIGPGDLEDLIYFLNHPQELEENEEEVQPKFFRRIGRWIRRAFTRPAKYTPKGTVNIENTNSNPSFLQPFMNAKISIGRNFFWTNTYTNFNGDYVANKSYRGMVRVRSKFRSASATIRKSWNEVIGLGVSDHIMTVTRGNNSRTRNILYGSRRHFWIKATTHNGIALYNDFCLRNGISETVRNANVWAWSNGDNASAPMLYTYPQLGLIAQYANIGQANLWQNITSTGTATAIGLVPFWLRPDMIFRGLEDKPISPSNSINSSIRIHQVVFHESGHFSHAKKVNALYWAKNAAAIISNSIATTNISLQGGDSYRDGSQPSFQAADRISVVEGWGNLTEYKVTSEVYGGAYIRDNFISAFGFNSIDERMESFDMFRRPMSFNRTDVRSWFLHGLMWDLLDHRNEGFNGAGRSELRNGDNTGAIPIVDNCVVSNTGMANIFALGPIFNVLQQDVENACDLQEELVQNYPAQSTQIDELFLSYGIFCLQ
jgi:hypothetical protein